MTDMKIGSRVQIGDIQTIHFVGIGGIGMSGLARLFLHEGKRVSGSDRAPSDITRSLEAEGVTVYSSQVGANIAHDVDLVVYTEAMPQDHEELVCARTRGIPTMNYFDALGMVANEYYLIAVAGSHGKTTTTAMLIDIFERAYLDPSAIVGSLRAATKSNYRRGKSKYFIVEACEYRRDFMSLKPDILVITNIELEHVDYYPTLESVQQAFREFAEKVPGDGFVIADTHDARVAPVLTGLAATVVDYRAHLNPLRTLTVPGMHNQLNAAAAVAAAAQVGVSVVCAETALAHFKGTWRRFEYKGELNGAKVYDDYGHHPTEIIATIQGARELYPDRRLTVVFQSHTFSRTHTLFADFVHALSHADRVIVLPIYAAREVNGNGVSHTLLVDAIGKTHAHAYAVDSFEDAAAMVRESVSSEDVVLVMGAGDITAVTKILFS